MMRGRKKELLEKVVAYRFQPIKDELFDLLQEYEEICKREKDEDGLACVYFYRGEAFFRLGKYDPCITYLNCSLMHRKKEENSYLEAAAYNVLGLMFSLLGYEVVALEHYLQSLDSAEKYGLYNQKAITYINMGWLYRDLDDLVQSLKYYDLALEELKRSDSDNYYNIEILCHAYRGQIFCNLEQYEKALECGCIIERLRKKNSILFYDVSVENLYVRLYDYLGEKEKVNENLYVLIEQAKNGIDFLEFCEFYIDVCNYALSKGMRTEARILLNCLHANIDATELIYIKLKVQSLEVVYQNRYSHYENYLNACREYMVMQEKYEYYIKKIKLTGMQNIQNLRKTQKEKEKYEEISRRDKMTGLLNKVTLEESIRTYLEKNKEYDRCPALILIDLDHFKNVNDTLGHLTGDQLICDVADKIKTMFPYSEMVGRVGGDEFVVFFSEAYTKEDSIARADELRRELNKLTYCDENCMVTASMGIAFLVEAIDRYETLFSIADDALYEAKHAGRNQIVIGN